MIKKKDLEEEESGNKEERKTLHKIRDTRNIAGHRGPANQSREH